MWPGPSTKHLHAAFPGPLRQVADFGKLGNLRSIGRVRNAAGAKRVSKADGHVVFPQNFEQLVVMLIERIFVARHFHPCEQQGTAARDNVHLPSFAQKHLDGSAVEPGVDRHEIDAFFRVGAHDLQKVLRGDVFQVFFQITDGVVNGNGADHGGGGFDQLSAGIRAFCRSCSDP